jgi:hypothetical protein
MGLPTTANYLVVASLLAGVLVELGSASGLVLPLIAVHLYVFYFGILADDTPPVCLAAFAAAAISRADPLKTGVQSFAYDIRTAILPFIFIFNPQILLIGVESWAQGIVVFLISLVAMLCFASATQGWLLVKVRFYEAILLLVATLALFRPGALLNQVYPEFSPIDVERFVAGKVSVEPDRAIRVHVTRETRYGDRYRLFRFESPESATEGSPWAEFYGLVLEQEPDGRFYVSDLTFNGLAEQAGFEFGDYVTEVDVEQLNRPAKEWVWPIAFGLIGLVFFLQWPRWQKEKSASLQSAT